MKVSAVRRGCVAVSLKTLKRHNSARSCRIGLKFSQLVYIFFYFYFFQKLIVLRYSLNFQVTGHSLGASLASVGASWVVKAGIFNPDSVKVFTAGQPRTGDYNYALWHQNTVHFRAFARFTWRQLAHM